MCSSLAPVPLQLLWSPYQLHTCLLPFPVANAVSLVSGPFVALSFVSCSFSCPPQAGSLCHQVQSPLSSTTFLSVWLSLWGTMSWSLKEWLSMASYSKHSPKPFSFHLHALSSSLSTSASLYMPSSVMTSVHFMLYLTPPPQSGTVTSQITLLLPRHHLTEKTMVRECCQSLVFTSDTHFLPWDHQKPSV